MLTQVLPEVTYSMYGLTFLEGILAFVSPCILPLLPVYLMYLAGQDDFEGSRKVLIKNTLGFIVGFSIVFILLGASASALGRLFSANRQILERVAGLIMVLFGLNYLGLFNLGILNKISNFNPIKGRPRKKINFFTSAVFGATFSLGWTPCLSAFLGSALLLASNAGTLYQGMALLLLFSLGLGLPFLLTALLWERMQTAIGWIKRNFQIIKIVSGGLLILIGLMMVFGLFTYYSRLFL